MNMFRGQVQTNQVFPFPRPLNEDQEETLKMLIDPLEKFFEVNLVFYFVFCFNCNYTYLF